MYRFDTKARRWQLFVALAGLAVITTSSCSSSGSGGSGDVTLTVQSLPDSEFKAMQCIANEFEAGHPNVKVNLQTVSNDAKTGTNLTVLTGSNPPDIGFAPIDTQVYTAMLNGKQLVPLTDVWQNTDLAKRYGAIVSRALHVDGVPYTVDIDVVYYNIVYYNAGLFSKLGIGMPADHRLASMNDLVSIADKLRKDGYQPLGIGPTSGYESSWLIDAFLPSTATPEQQINLDTNYRPSVPMTTKYTDPSFVSVLQSMEEMKQRNVFQDGFLGQDVPTAEASFLQGKTGMMVSGSWASPGWISSGLHFKLGWVLYPSLEQGKQMKLNSYFGNTLVIPTGAKNKDLAKQFLKTVVSDKAQVDCVAKAAGLLPSVNSVKPSDVTTDPTVSDLVSDANANGTIDGWSSVVPAEVGSTFIEPLLQKMWAGELTPDEVAQQTQDNVEKVRSSSH
jgi:raffinose/stachyose/melibiose transport system substrate-binding protein